MKPVVVVDTGPLIHLAQADILTLLELTGDLHVPEPVLEELERGSTDISELAYTVVPVTFDPDTEHPQLDTGETAALVIARQRDGLLLTDDLDARTIAENDGIEVHGSVGVVLYAFSRGELSEAAAKRVLRGLERDTSLYLSAPLIEHAIGLVESDDAGW